MKYILIASLFAFSAAASAQSAQDLYKTKCQACHAADGSGNTPAGQKLGVHPFNSPEVAKKSDEELFNNTRNGKNKMPAFAGKLTDDQIKDLVKYIRSLK